MLGYKIFIYVSQILLYGCVVTGTLSRKSPGKRSSESKGGAVTVLSGPQDYTVFSKNLVVPEVTSEDVIRNNGAFFRETDNYNVDAPVLGYVTPWNSHGYDIAKIFGNKFTHISPVWLQLKRHGKGKYEVTGTHDVDKKWMADIRNAGRERKLKVVPRIIFEGWTQSDFKELMQKKGELDALVDTLLKCSKTWNFDGLVLEVWMQLINVISEDSMIKLVQKIGESHWLHKLELILVIPPRRQYEFFGQYHFDALYDYVSGFSLMTYDFSSSQHPGPNAPIDWMEDCVTSLTSDKEKRKKIFTGFNFYGYEYSSNTRPLLGRDYLKILSDFGGKLSYDAEAAEHYFSYKDSAGKHIIYYPTLYSISKRINKTTSLNTGISIWELGQGLDYFYDLL